MIWTCERSGVGMLSWLPSVSSVDTPALHARAVARIMATLDKEIAVVALMDMVVWRRVFQVLTDASFCSHLVVKRPGQLAGGGLLVVVGRRQIYCASGGR